MAAGNGAFGKGGWPGCHSLLSDHVGSVPLLGTMIAVLLLMFGTYTDLWHCLFWQGVAGGHA